jgi:hypothetical protein
VETKPAGEGDVRRWMDAIDVDVTKPGEHVAPVVAVEKCLVEPPLVA